VKALWTIIDIEGGVVKVNTESALIQAGPNGVDMKTNEIDVKANE